MLVTLSLPLRRLGDALLDELGHDPPHPVLVPGVAVHRVHVQVQDRDAVFLERLVMARWPHQPPICSPPSMRCRRDSHSAQADPSPGMCICTDIVT